MKVIRLFSKYLLVFLIVYISHFSTRINAKIVDGSNNESKVIYLTFDDGPSYLITNRILDILKEKQVKGTFFVVGNQIKDREKILKRIYVEGHSIGLHTYTHKYKKIYKSEEAFIEEMRKTSDEINSVIGISPTIIRFPSGSKRRLNDDFLEKLHKEKYKVFDWNANLSDGITPNLSCEILYRNAIKLKNHHLVILLMHCNADNKKTCDTLPRIIEHYKSIGYVFKTITDETPEYYFRY
jgi:peptidoglycan/xylan/chitin deacetylase (PgdA/CDA1 family)